MFLRFRGCFGSKVFHGSPRECRWMVWRSKTWGFLQRMNIHCGTCWANQGMHMISKPLYACMLFSRCPNVRLCCYSDWQIDKRGCFQVTNLPHQKSKIWKSLEGLHCATSLEWWLGLGWNGPALQFGQLWHGLSRYIVDWFYHLSHYIISLYIPLYISPIEW